jgi:hypothetical protein
MPADPTARRRLAQASATVGNQDNCCMHVHAAAVMRHMHLCLAFLLLLLEQEQACAMQQLMYYRGHL